jgi:hypothetical protein
MRKSSFFFSYLAVCLILLNALLAHSLYEQSRRYPEIRGKCELVRSLELTDLCLFTEARYTRHPSLADFYAPFQDHPCSMEHFPSGSLITPNRRNAETYARMD